MKRIIFRLACLLLAVVPQCMAAQTSVDSAAFQAASKDSLVQELTTQVQELKLQRIMLQEELERNGRSARLDSVQRAHRQQRIDSLRMVTSGAPLVIDGDTLLTLYARRGGLLPELRVKNAREKILDLGKRLTLKADSITIYESDLSTDLMAGEEVVLSLTDMDGLWMAKPRAELAREYARVIQSKLDELHAEYGLRQKLIGLLLALLVVVAQWLLIRLTNRLFRQWKFRLARRVISSLRPISLKDYEFLNVHRQSILLLWTYNALRYAAIIFQLFISVTLLFSIFPETKTLMVTLLGYVWNPFRSIVLAFLGYLPNVFQIAVIYVCFRYLVKGVKYLASEIEAERLRLNGFYPDWAQPTYYILRTLLYSLMFVMIWPLLPNSDSQVFQGVSVFIGVIVSLGSTSIVGNLMAGLVMTYMRPFRIGDYIKVGDTVGEVVEKTVLVTRIRTRKNEVVTIQNSSLMGSQTSNYTVAAQTYRLIVHTKVTIGYDVPWQLVKQIMEGAAADTEGLLKEPRPFMMTTALDDFYVEYEINAYTDDAVRLPALYSQLHQNLLRRFFEAGVEIMSPHIYARRDGMDLQMPPEYTPKTVS